MRDSAGHRDTVAQSSCGKARLVDSRYIFPDDLLRSRDGAGQSSSPGGQASDDEPDSPSSWWLVYTKSRQEKQLSRQLSEMSVPHYVPVHYREAFTRGRPRRVEEPLFAGYLFLYADGEQRRTALSTNRISTTHPVDDGERLRRELRQIEISIASGARLTLEARLKPGDWARVKGGVHAGLEGVVLRRQNQTRLVLSVNFLKQGASLEVRDSMLERIDPPDSRQKASIEIVRRF